MAARTSVTVADVLRLRDAGLSASETWSLLCQATQGLQDLFLSRCVLPQKAVPRITPSGLQLTRFGRVRLELAYADCGEHCDVYVAPERRSGGQVACDASSLEKALIFSLGTALQRAVQSEVVTGGDLEAVLQSMVRPDPYTRASLMDLLDMISEYCKTRAETKPFSHLVTDMYREVLATPPQASKCLPSNQNVIHPNSVIDSAQRTNSFPKEYQRRDTEERNTKINKSYSLAPKTDRGLRLAPQRAPSRLYRTASSSRDIEPRAKYCCPNTCIGPEFIIKATKPSKCIHIKGVKAACKKKVVVILLNGQKIDVTCDQNTTTVRQIFEVVVISEGLEDNFTLGLAALLGGDFAFLPHKTKLRKVAPVGWRGDSKKDAAQSYTFTLYLRVKFFMPSLRGVRNWTMKHLLYLQLRRNLLEQQIQCNIDQHIALSGLALQSEFGDYLDQEHGHGAYFLLEHYIPESLLVQHEDEQALRAQMQLLHKKRHGLDPGRAEEIYINLVQMLKGYGTHFYNAVLETKDEYSHEMLLAIDSQGLALYKNYRNERHLHEFLIWKRIQLLSYNKQYLFIMPQYDNKGTLKPTKYKLQMDHKKSFYVFHLASFHHQISMKLRFDVNSLRSLTAEFGVSIKNHLGRESRLYHIENNETGNLRRQQCVLIAPCNVKHTQKAVAVIQRDNKADVANVVPVCDRLGVSQYLKQINIEEHQNKENENPEAQKVHYCNSYTLAVRNEQRKATNSRTDIQDHVCSALSRNTVNDVKGTSFPQRIRVRMGTKAFFSDVRKESSCSYQKPCDTASTIISSTSKHSSLQDAYVLNSSIKSAAEKFEVDFQETLSESLLEKFDTLSCKEERILRTVKIRRDECGNLGLQIKAGSGGGGLYVQSVVPDGPAAALGTIRRGDQLIAMDGHSLLNLKYEEAMDLFRSSGTEVEILLSQIGTDIGTFVPEEELCDAKAVGYLKHSNHQDSAVEMVPGGKEFETISAPTAKQQLYVEKRPSPGHNSRGIRAVCCVSRAEDG